jgi:hypothetical protein
VVKTRLQIYGPYLLVLLARPPIAPPVVIPPASPMIANAHAHFATTQKAFFTHTVQNKANSIRFAHQSLCSPRLSTLPKAICRGYLKGCPNLTAKGVTTYLSPSPASAKGHMKRQQHSLCSTHCNVPTDDQVLAPYFVPLHKHVVPIIDNDDEGDKFNNISNQTAYVNVIHNDGISNSNLF